MDIRKWAYHHISRQETLKGVADVGWHLYSTNKKDNRIKNDSDFSRLSECLANDTINTDGIKRIKQV